MKNSFRIRSLTRVKNFLLVLFSLSAALYVPMAYGQSEPSPSPSEEVNPPPETASFASTPQPAPDFEIGSLISNYSSGGPRSPYIMPLNEGLMGDNHDIDSGSVTFRQVDVSIPGNSSLPVEFARTASGKSLQAGAEPYVGPLGNVWDVDLPYIVYRKYLGTATTGLNSNAGSGVAIHIGTKLHVPGAGQQDLGSPISTAPSGFGGSATKSLWVSNRSGNDVETSYLVKSPQGTTYQFDKVITRSSTFNFVRPAGYQSSFLVDTVYVYPTQITDVHGNWVKYSYNSYGVTKIWSSDGRTIDIAYSGQFISSVTANARTWSYSYQGNNLKRIDLPDTRYWTFGQTATGMEYNGLKDGDCLSKRNGVAGRNIVMRHPSGTTATFETDAIHNGIINAPQHPFNADASYGGGAPSHLTACSMGSLTPEWYLTRALLKKTLTLASGESYVWTYDYDQPSNATWLQACISYTNGVCSSYTKYYKMFQDAERLRTFIDPLGHKSKFYLNSDWLNESSNGFKLGSVLKQERFETASSSTPLETTTTDSVERFNSAYGWTSLASNVGTGGYLIAPSKKTVTRDGDTFTYEFDYEMDIGASAFANLSPIQTKTSSNVSTSPRVTDITYHNDWTNWILLLTDTWTINGQQYIDYDYGTSGNSLGQKTSVKKYGAAYATFGYHSNASYKGALHWARDALTRQTQLLNWKRGKPQLVVYPDVTSMSQIVDNNGWVTSLTDPNSQTTAYQYDSMGRVTLINPPGSYFSSTQVAYSFPTNGPVQTMTQGNRQTVITHDSLYRPILKRMRDTTTTSGQSYVKTTYDALGRAVFTSFPSSSSSSTSGTTSNYDALGRMTSTAENVAPFATTSYAYLSSHRTAVTDPASQVTTTWTDGYGGPGKGDTLKIQQPENVTTDLYRDAFGKVTSVTQSGGGATITRNYYYDTRQRLCRYVTPEAGHTVYAYDNAYQMTSYARGYTAGTGCVTPTGTERVQLTYWPKGALRATAFNDGVTPDIERTYDANDNLTRMYRGNSGDAVNWDYEYDVMNNMTREKLTTDGRIYDTTYVYNQLGDVTKTTLPGGFDINYTLDALGHDKTVQIGTSNLATNAVYHAGGFLSTMSYGNGHAYTLTPDARLKPARIRAFKTGTVAFDQQYAYTARGQISAVTDLADSGNTRSYGYDNLGRLETASGPWGAGSFTYDALGNLKTKARGTRSVINVYDAPSNRLIRSLDNLPLASGGQGDRWIAYDGRGNMQQFGSTWLAYDKNYQMKSSAATATGTTASYKYDGHQKRVRIISSKPSAAMMSASGSGGPGDAFSTDLARLTSAAKTSDAASRSASSLSPSDVSDILASLLSTATEGRSELTSRGTAETMVASARPVYADRSRGGFAAYKEVEARSELDRSTESLASTMSTSSAASPGCTGPTDTTIFNVYDAAGQLALVDKAHLCKMTLYVRGAGMDLARIEVDTVALTYTRTYLHADQLGSATAGTSQSGAVLWREQYAPYGDKLTAPTANDDLGSFTGHIDDDATTDMNLTYMQARYYDPGAGRFTSVDPVTFLDTGEPGMVSRYSYALNDPVNMMDPDGRAAVNCTIIVGEARQTGVKCSASDDGNDDTTLAITVLYIDDDGGQSKFTNTFTYEGDALGFGFGASSARKAMLRQVSEFCDCQLTTYKANASKTPPSQSQVWQNLSTYRGSLKRDKDGNIYSYDRLHGEVEVFNKRGKHLGAIDPNSGRWVKGPRPGRSIDPDKRG